MIDNLKNEDLIMLETLTAYQPETSTIF